MILKAAAKDALAAAVESGRDGIARLRFDQFVVESEFHPRCLRRQKGFQNFVRSRIAHRLQPLPAARAVKPPFRLHAGSIHPVKAVALPFADGRIRRRPLFYFPAEAKFVNRAIAAIRAWKQERHYLPNTFLVPASGMPQIADASSVSAAISSGSR